MSSSLGTLTISANVNTTFDAPNDGVKAILIGSETGLTVTVTMESGGVQKTLYPGTVDWFQVKKGFTGKILIKPIVILNNVSTFPASTLIFDAIGLNDPEEAYMYPIALPSRNTNIGNSVNTNLGGSTSLQNDNNAANTVFIEATQTGSSGSNVSVDVAGDITIKEWTGSVLNTIFQVLANNATKVKMGLVSTLSEVMGNLKVDGTLESVGNATMDGTLTVTGNIIANGGMNINTIRDDVNGNAAMDLSAGTGDVAYNHRIIMPNNIAIAAKDSGGTAQVLVMMNTDNTGRVASGASGATIFLTDSTNGLTTAQAKILQCGSGGNFKGLAGTISRFTFFTGTGSGTYSHSQGVTPQWVCAVTNVAGSATQGFDSGNSSTVHITLGAANAFTAFVVNS